MSARTKFSVGAIVILGTLVWLGWGGASQSKSDYHTISELSSLHGAARDQRMRVSGNVVQGSIRHLQGRIDFVLTEQGNTLPVSYVGDAPLPDTFKGAGLIFAAGRKRPSFHFRCHRY